MALFEQFPGEKAVIKMWESIVDKGVGGLLSPWQIKREGRARLEVRREELLLNEQTRADIQAIRRGELRFEGNRLVEVNDGREMPRLMGSDDVLQFLPPAQSSSSTTSMMSGALSDLLLESTEERVNLREVLIMAEKEAAGVDDTEVADETIDPEWYTLWRDMAKRASRPELRLIWAKLLAGETSQPGQFQSRTLRILSEMTSTDAEAVRALAGAKLLNRNLYVYPDGNVEGLPSTHIAKLAELGIIESATPMWSIRLYRDKSDAQRLERTIRLPSRTFTFQIAEEGWPSIAADRFTSAGLEIISLIDPQSIVTPVGVINFIRKTADDAGIRYTNQPTGL